VDLLLTSEWGTGFDNLIEPQDRPLLQLVPKEEVEVEVEVEVVTTKEVEAGVTDLKEKHALSSSGSSSNNTDDVSSSSTPAAAAEASTAAAEIEVKDASKKRSPSSTAQPLSPAVGRLANELSPKYHFAGGQPLSFALLPYANNLDMPCRFYGIGGPAASKGKVGKVFVGGGLCVGRGAGDD
jgi:hypothetical protein